VEILLWIIGGLVVLSLIAEAIKSINWIKFLCCLVFGGVALAVLFSYTSEGVLVIVGAYAVLLILSVLFGAFKNMAKES